MVSLPNTARRPHGFTLTELLVGVTIMGVLAAVAAPSFSSLGAGMRGRSAASDLYTALVRARNTAITLNQEVALVPAGAANTWQGGWKMPDPADATRNLDVHGAIAGATITGPATLSFLPNGRLRGGGEPQFDISVSGSPQHRCVTINLAGRANQTNNGCS
jgi:type IV fimbrial biogenesis protein FimT